MTKEPKAPSAKINAKKAAKTKTRKAILYSLKQKGASTAPALAKQLDLTPMAVRLHLYDLAEEGLLDFTEEKSGRGRPSKYWKLTEKSQSIFPDAHQSLCVDLMSSIRQSLGEEGLKRVVSTHSQNQCAQYKATLCAMETTEERLAALVDIRTKEGYMASLSSGTVGAGATKPDQWHLHENHCPICSAAQTCTQLCANELWVFKNVLGPSVEVERVEHILSGSRRCTYKITKK